MKTKTEDLGASNVVGWADHEIRSLDTSSGVLEAVVSTREIDRYGSIILPSGVRAHLESFAQNPVFCWQHDTSRVIGRCRRVWVTPDDLEVRAELEFDLNSRFSANVFRLYSEGYLRAFSPRSRVHKTIFSWSSPAKKDELRSLDPWAAEQLEAGNCEYVITEHEYLEISAVTIPGNASALAERALTAGVIDRDFASEFLGQPAPSSWAINFEREERRSVEIKNETEFGEKLAEIICERIARASEPNSAGFSDEQRDEVREISRASALEILAEIFPADGEK